MSTRRRHDRPCPSDRLLTQCDDGQRSSAGGLARNSSNQPSIPRAPIFRESLKLGFYTTIEPSCCEAAALLAGCDDTAAMLRGHCCEVIVSPKKEREADCNVPLQRHFSFSMTLLERWCALAMIGTTPSHPRRPTSTDITRNIQILRLNRAGLRHLQ